MNLDYSIRKLFTENHYQNMKFLSKLTKTLLYLQLLLKFLDKLSYRIIFDTKSALNLSKQIKSTIKIEKLVGKFPLKEITFFKHFKQNFKFKFSNFLSKSTTSFTSFVFYDNYIITGGRDHVLKVWNKDNLRLVKHRFFHKGYIMALEIDSSSKYLLSGSKDHLICLWNINGLKLLKYFVGHFNTITSLKFLVTYKVFASGSADQTIRIWNSCTNKLIRLIFLYCEPIYIMKLGESGSKILICCNTLMLKSNLNENKVFFSASQLCYFDYAVYAKEEGKIVTGDENMIKIFDSKDFKLISNKKHEMGKILHLDYNSKNKIIAGCFESLVIGLWHIFNLNSSKVLCTYPTRAVLCRCEFNQLYCFGEQGRIFTYNEKFEKNFITTISKEYLIRCICISTKLQLICYSNCSIYLYSLKTESDIARANVDLLIGCLAFADSTILCGNFCGRIFFLNVPDLVFIKVFYFSAYHIIFANLSKINRILAFSDFNKLKLLNFKAKRIMFKYDKGVLTGTFNEKFNFFVFVDMDFSIYLLKEFSRQ